MHQLIVNAIGPDRPGIVGQFTGHLHDAGANVLDSRMVNLRGQFVLVMLVEAEEAVAPKLANTLPAVGEKMGLKLTVGPVNPAAAPVSGLPFRLKTYSMDQPGIVHRVTSILQRHGVNIEEMQARQESGAFMGTPLFIMEMRLTLPPTVPVRKLRSELEGLCDQLNCDLDLEPA